RSHRLLRACRRWRSSAVAPSARRNRRAARPGGRRTRASGGRAEAGARLTAPSAPSRAPPPRCRQRRRSRHRRDRSRGASTESSSRHPAFAPISQTGRVAPRYLYDAAELVDHAADLLAQGAVLQSAAGSPPERSAAPDACRPTWRSPPTGATATMPAAAQPASANVRVRVRTATETAAGRLRASSRALPLPLEQSLDVREARLEP